MSAEPIDDYADEDDDDARMSPWVALGVALMIVVPLVVLRLFTGS